METDSSTNSEIFNKFMDVLEEYLRTAAELVPKNTPRKEDFEELIKECQLMTNGLISGDIARTRELSKIMDIYSIRRVEERIKELRMIEMVTAMTEALRRASK